MLWKLLFAGMTVIAVILFTRLLFLKKQIRNVTAQIERHIKALKGAQEEGAILKELFLPGYRMNFYENLIDQSL